MRLIDADETLHKAWQNFYKQEDDHRHLDGYDIMRDQFYEQSGFECCQQTIVNAPTVEAIPKADYENRLKADLVAMLTEVLDNVEEVRTAPKVLNNETADAICADIAEILRAKINKLRGEEK